MAVPTVKLNNGRQMPVLGLGTWMLINEEGVEVVKKAIDAGYRHFDTALLYHNERSVGEAIRQKIADGTVTRKDLFITDKLWCSYAHPGLVVKACKKSLNNLGLDYVDLYLMHFPLVFKATEKADEVTETVHAGADAAEVIFNNQEYFPRDSSGNLAESSGDYVETWKEMEKCVELGLAKSIGISNFNSEQIERLLKHATIKPVTNQVEVHLYLNQKKLIEFCRRRDIVITSYGPLGGAIVEKEGVTPRMLEHPTLLKIAATHKKTPAQVALRYLVQLGTVAIPKTCDSKRLVENISIFEFSLSPDEMTDLDSMNRNERKFVIPGTENHKHFPFKCEF